MCSRPDWLSIYSSSLIDNRPSLFNGQKSLSKGWPMRGGLTVLSKINLFLPFFRITLIYDDRSKNSTWKKKHNFSYSLRHPCAAVKTTSDHASNKSRECRCLKKIVAKFWTVSLWLYFRAGHYKLIWKGFSWLICSGLNIPAVSLNYYRLWD